MEKKRCHWVNLDDEQYIKYHDEEWGIPVYDDHTLYAMLILECFQAGLSWQCILHKRKAFYKAFDDFDIYKNSSYQEDKIEELLKNSGIIRNRLKIRAVTTNAQAFRLIQKEFGSFSNYLWQWTHHQIVYETGKTTSDLSDQISKDLKKRGMKFVGSTIIYSYLQAVGVINSHEEDCFCCTKKVG